MPVLYNLNMTAEPAGSTGDGVRELPATQARNQMSELLDLVRDGEFVYLTRRGKRVAVLMPADIGEDYERIEDAYWAHRARQAKTGDTVPWEQVIADLEGTGGTEGVA